MTRPRPRSTGSNRFGPPRWPARSPPLRAAADPASATRPGYLVINPLNLPRRAAVVLPDADLDLRPDGPLRAAQFTDEGVWAVVDLPAFGFAWVNKETDLGRPPASSVALSARGRQLRTSRWKSRSTRSPGAFAAWRRSANRRPGSGNNSS